MIAIVQITGPNGAGGRYEIQSPNELTDIFKEMFELVEFESEEWSLIIHKAKTEFFGQTMKNKCLEQLKLILSNKKPENPGYFVSAKYAVDIYESLLEEDQKYVMDRLRQYFTNRKNAD